MLNLISDNDLNNWLNNFLGLYRVSGVKPYEVFEFIDSKLEEKEVKRSLDENLITEDEVCSFIMSHLYTRFILPNENAAGYEASDPSVDKVKHDLKSLLFYKSTSV